MNRPLDIDFYIGFFSAIPEKRWTTGTIHSLTGRRCAVGLCFKAQITVPGVMQLTRVPLPTINDNLHPDYSQPTPKKRILAYLKDVKAGRAK